MSNEKKYDQEKKFSQVQKHKFQIRVRKDI